jgi:hypothetical protein
MALPDSSLGAKKPVCHGPFNGTAGAIPFLLRCALPFNVMTSTGVAELPLGQSAQIR